MTTEAVHLGGKFQKITECGVKSGPAFCLGPSIEKTNIVRAMPRSAFHPKNLTQIVISVTDEHLCETLT